MRVAYNYKQQPVWEPEDQHFTHQLHSSKVSHGNLTIIDQNSLLEKLFNQEKIATSCNTYNVSLQSSKKNDQIKGRIRMKKQLKLLKIMAVKQRRSIFRDISEVSQQTCDYKSFNPIEIVCNVYDDMSNDFEKMCKYYALIQNDNNNPSTNLNKDFQGQQVLKIQQIIFQDLNQERIKQESGRRSNQNIKSTTQNQKQNFNGQHFKEEFQNFPVSTSMTNQQSSINQFAHYEIYDQEGISREKQDRFYQQLQLLVTPNSAGLHQNSIEESLQILQKCMYLTQTSHVHSIMSNLLNDFSNISSASTTWISDSQNLSEEEDEEEEAAGTLLKKKDSSCQRMNCRTNTSYSRSSVTTQPIFSKPSSTPSISNILENSHCQESTKAEMSDVANMNIENDNNSENNISNNKIKGIKISQNQQQIEQEEQQEIIKKILSEKKEEQEYPHCNQEKNDEKVQNSLKRVHPECKEHYVGQCKKYFKLKNLSPQQLNQFKFSQYKKKNSASAATFNNGSNSAGCSPKNAINSQMNQSGINCSGKNINGNVSKFGKYHNYNKLFMYNILNMFQPNNLANMHVPEVISKELQMLISRIKTSAKNNYKVEGKYAFDYFSHAHYNVLFLQLTPQNIQLLSHQEEYVSLYKTCFNLDLTEKISNITLTYINIIKVYCYQIFIECIREEDIKIDNSLTQENLKNQYTLKVIRGIKKLSQGLIIKRF